MKINERGLGLGFVTMFALVGAAAWYLTNREKKEAMEAGKVPANPESQSVNNTKPISWA